jgi:hypothetical protein
MAINGGGRFSGVNNYDWYAQNRRMSQTPVAGIQASTKPQSAPTAICGRALDDSVVAGGLGGIPITPGSVTAGMLGGTAYPAPTYAAPTPTSITATNIGGSSTVGIGCAVAVTVGVTNVPQDGSVMRAFWVFRPYQAGQADNVGWSPWAEVMLPGAPHPASALSLSFVYGGVTNGGVYDFGLMYVSAGGTTGAISVFQRQYAVNAVGIPSQYMLGGVAIAPSLTNVVTPSVSSGTIVSINGISAALTWSLQVTNQPTDGSLSRYSFFIQQAGASAWTFYSSIPAAGVGSGSPPAGSGQFNFTFADVTNGVGYNFGIAFENAQGGESNITTIGSLSAQQLTIPTSALATMPSGQGISITSASIGVFQNAGQPTAQLPFNMTYNDWSVGSPPNWFLGVRVFLRVSGSGSTSGEPMGDYVPPTSSNTITGMASLPAGGKCDIGFAFIDNQNNLSSIGWPAGTANIQVPQLSGTNVAGAGSVNMLIDSLQSSGIVFDKSNGTKSSKGSPYVSYVNIDGISVWVQPGSGQGNPFISNGKSAVAIWGSTAQGVSPIQVTAGLPYIVSGYVDVRQSSAGSGYWRIVDATNGTEYARASISAGNYGYVYSAVWIPTANTTVTVNGTFDSINGYSVLSIPMLAQTSAQIPYVPGPADPSQQDYSRTASSVKQVISSSGNVNVNPPGGVTGNLPYSNSATALQAAIDASGNILVSEFGTSLVTQAAGAYAGYMLQSGTSVVDTNGYALGAAGAWLWQEWVSVTPGTAKAGNGPTFTDGIGTYWFMDCYGGGGTLFAINNAGTQLAAYGLAANNGSDGKIHRYTFGMENVDNVGNYRFVGYVDDTLVIDVTYNALASAGNVRCGWQHDTGYPTYQKQFGVLPSSTRYEASAPGIRQVITRSGTIPVSTALNPQMSIVGMPNSTVFSYTSSTTSGNVSSVTISWTAFTLYFTDGISSQNIAANSYTLGNLVGNTPYYFNIWVNATTGVHVQQTTSGQTPATTYSLNTDGNCAVALAYPCSTPVAPSSGTSSGGGGSPSKPTCPGFNQIMRTQEHGRIIAGRLRPGMHVYCSLDGKFKEIHVAEIMDGYICDVTIGNATFEVDVDHVWLRAGGDPSPVSPDWIFVRNLTISDLIEGESGCPLQVRGIANVREGKFVRVEVEGNVLSFGDEGAVAHNAVTY